MSTSTMTAPGRQSSTWSEECLTFAIVYFWEGPRSKEGGRFNSRDGSDRYTVKDPYRTGLVRLVRMIDTTFGPSKVKTAVIYDNRTGQEIAKYSFGMWL